MAKKYQKTAKDYVNKKGCRKNGKQVNEKNKNFPNN
jgi:hypothetical protein